jgi:hypothetical protein
MRLVFLPAMLLAGCATLADVDKAKDSWNGARYDDVVSRWGPPNRSMTLADGRQVSTWVAEGASGGFPGVIGVFGGSGGGGIGATIGLPGMGGGEPQRCERTLTFRNDRVAEQSWLGHPALCSSFKRE